MSHFIELRYSDDGGNNWSNWKPKEAGTTGSFLKKLEWTRLGSVKTQRIWEIRDTSNVAGEILAATLDGEDFPLPDGSYSDDTRPWADQDVNDFLPTFAEAKGTRSRVKYVPVPGLVAFAGVGNGPHRGIRDVEGKLFVVSGNTLYQVATDGTATSRGTIPGTRRVSMVHNQIDGGNELIIATGDNSYVWNTVTETLTATGVPLLFVDFLNQLIIGIDVARRFWRWSGLADATAWNSLDNESAESSPDRLVGQIVSQGEVLLFGERTIEVWSNSPSGNLTFQRSTVIEKGCANGNTICRLDNTVYFVGNDSIAYRLQGYTPVPISSKAITDTISDGDPSKLFAFTWEDKGYVCYYLTAQDGNTWGFDVTCQKWHRRESFGLTRWRVNTLCKWNGDWYAGDYSNGKLYRLTWGNVYEGCEIMPRTLRTGVMHNNGNRMFISAVKLLVNTGREPSVNPSGDPPTITGNLPDGFVGDVVDYQYTVTPAYPGQTVTLSVTGALPTGLTMDSTGHVTGTLTTAGTFSWTITPSSDCGDGAALADSTTVEPAIAAVPWFFTGTHVALSNSDKTGAIADDGSYPDYGGMATQMASPISAPYYFEVRIDSIAECGVGVTADSGEMEIYQNLKVVLYWTAGAAGSTVFRDFNITVATVGTKPAVGEVVRVAVRPGVGVWLAIEAGTWIGGGDPAANTSPTVDETYSYPFAFGARTSASAFSTFTILSLDADFHQPAPVGFVSLGRAVA